MRLWILCERNGIFSGFSSPYIYSEPFHSRCFDQIPIFPKQRMIKFLMKEKYNLGSAKSLWKINPTFLFDKSQNEVMRKSWLSKQTGMKDRKAYTVAHSFVLFYSLWEWRCGLLTEQNVKYLKVFISKHKTTLFSLSFLSITNSSLIIRFVKFKMNRNIALGRWNFFFLKIKKLFLNNFDVWANGKKYENVMNYSQLKKALNKRFLTWISPSNWHA